MALTLFHGDFIFHLLNVYDYLRLKASFLSYYHHLSMSMSNVAVAFSNLIALIIYIFYLFIFSSFFCVLWLLPLHSFHYAHQNNKNFNNQAITREMKRKTLPLSLCVCRLFSLFSHFFSSLFSLMLLFVHVKQRKLVRVDNLRKFERVGGDEHVKLAIETHLFKTMTQYKTKNREINNKIKREKKAKEKQNKLIRCSRINHTMWCLY